MADIIFNFSFTIWLICMFFEFRNKLKFGVFITKNTYILLFQLIVIPIIWALYNILFVLNR